MKRALALALFVAAPLLAQPARIASDFEMRQMEQQLAREHDFVAQLSGRLNLGDLRLSRNEPALANGEYAKALEIAGSERIAARRASQMTRYATATSYAALAEAKLAHAARAYELAEEALRYTSDSAKTWNLYANTMALLGKTAKAVSAERNAVATETDPLDLAIYKYSLASWLPERDEAKRLLVEVITSLKSKDFDRLKSAVVRKESFEIYSSARGDEAAYVSLVNRSQLRLASLYEAEGDLAGARATYRDVLATRTDDPTALAALARLAPTAAEREQYFAAAFDANPFSLPLIRDYERLWSAAPALSEAEGAKPPLSSTGQRVRHAIDELHQGNRKAASEALAQLVKDFPDNETLRILQREAEGETTLPSFISQPPKNTVRPTAAELRQLVNAKTVDRAALDKLTFESTVTFAKAQEAPNQTIFESGDIDGIPFRFAEPIAFTGSFAANTPLRLAYRILGATDVNGAGGLLLEPIRLEEIR